MTIFLIFIWYSINGDYMRVKIFDEECERDLEERVNEFLSSEIDLLDIKYQVAVGINGEEQIYCFSAMIIYH